MSQRRHPVEAPILRFGRGTDNEVFLPDIRVALRHAALEPRGSEFVIDAIGANLLQLDGKLVHQAVVNRKDAVQIGPYRIEVLEPEGDEELALSVELVEPLKDDLGGSALAGRTEFASLMPSKRLWSWVVFLGLLAIALGLPLAAFYVKDLRDATAALLAAPDRLWQTGEISSPHKLLGAKCTSCHELAFTQVRDAACVACHKTIAHHVEPQKLRLAELQETRCAACHQEHRGALPIVRQDQAFCIDCHADLKRKDKETALENVADFGRSHPEFRPSVIVDPAKPRFERLSLAAQPPPQECSGLKFPHQKHLDPKGVLDPQKHSVILACADCHRPEPGGTMMKPIRMEAVCQRCHLLQFDPSAPERRLPHGRPAEVVEVVRDFYAGLALRGGVKNPAAPAAVRRRPGEPLAEEGRLDALAWAKGQTENTLKLVFSKTVCGNCHTVVPPQDSKSEAWTIAPVLVTERWLPKAKFNHAKHVTRACQDCHAAEKSLDSQDVLLPKIAKCRECHGGAEASTAVPSSCLLCHVFHRPALGPMRPAEVSEKSAKP